MKRLLILASLGVTGLSSALAATLAVDIQAPDGRPLSGAVVMAYPLDTPGRANVPVKAIMDQIKLRFKPELLVIPVGSSVQFPNSDSVSHQIYSFSPTHPFQLPLYHGTPYPPVVFDRPGVVILGCNIHDAMIAYIVVTEAPYFGRSSAGGAWSADAIPAGRYRIAVWHPRFRELKPLEREFTVAEGAPAPLSIHIAQTLKPAALEGSRQWAEY